MSILCGICVAIADPTDTYNAYAIQFSSCIPIVSCESGVAQMLQGVGNELGSGGVMGCRFRRCTGESAVS